MNLLKVLAGIYRNFCSARGIWLSVMILFGVLNIVWWNFIAFVSFEGMAQWLIVGLVIYGWVFVFPSIVYLLDSKYPRPCRKI